ncbi:MAG: Na+/H+ antiporter subunit D, partial [Oceanicoccus sp.]|uniref:proton-conducting transporter transmembrane domain-containing protein n=1 Tax=Oceanicoccus sp. TaxID=2691044 RepID=UPI00261B142A
MIEWLHPAAPYLLGVFLIPLLKGRVRQAYLLLIPLLSLIAVVMLTVGEFGHVSLMGQELILGQVDKLSILFAYVFALMGFIGTLYALQVKNPGEHMAAYLYVGSALGVVFAGDYFTLFIFWEIMAFASAYLVFIQGGTAAISAGFRYLLVHISGGVCLLAGIVIHYYATGSILFGANEIGDNAQANLGFYLILA